MNNESGNLREKLIAAWSNSLIQLNIKADIVFYGDSLTYWGKFNEVFPKKKICNLGLRSDTLCSMLDRIGQLKILEPSCIFLMAGINDVAYLTIEEFSRQYKKLLEEIIYCIPNSNLIVQSILPVNNTDFNHISCTNQQIDKANEIIKMEAGRNGCKYLDINTVYKKDGQLPASISLDGIHLKPEGYSIWYNLLKSIYS